MGLFISSATAAIMNTCFRDLFSNQLQILISSDKVHYQV